MVLGQKILKTNLTIKTPNVTINGLSRNPVDSFKSDSDSVNDLDIGDGRNH
jgi:hypothetical protein